MSPSTLRAVLGNGGTNSRKVLLLVSLFDPRSRWLEAEGLTPATIVVIAMLAVWMVMIYEEQGFFGSEMRELPHLADLLTSAGE